MPAALFESKAITLADYAHLMRDTEVGEMIYDFLSPNSILNDVKIRTKASMKGKVLQVLPEHVTLPYSGWTKYDQTPEETKYGSRDFEEGMFLISNIFVMDRRAKRDAAFVVDPMKKDWNVWKIETNIQVSQLTINNDHADPTGQPLAPDGLRGRFRNVDRYKVPVRNEIDANGLDLTATGMTPANARELFAYISRALRFLGDTSGTSTRIYDNWVMDERIVAAAQSGPQPLLQITRDNFDWEILSFRGAKIRDLGFRIDDSTPVVNFEDADGTENTNGLYTSLWFVQWGDEGMAAWQPKAMDMEILAGGQDPVTGVKVRGLVDWGLGYLQTKPRCIARIKNIKVK